MSQIWIRDEGCVPSRQEFSLTQVLVSLFSLYISPTTKQQQKTMATTKNMAMRLFML